MASDAAQNNSPSSETKSHHKPAMAPRLAIFIAVIALLITLGGGLIVYQNWQNLVATQTHLQNENQTLQNNLMTLQKNLATQAQTVTATQNAVQQALTVKTQNHQAWQLSEAKYYIDLAQINLSTAKNIGVALALLQAADSQLANSVNPKILNLRQTLASDMEKLKAAPKIDKTGIIFTLQSLSQTVAQLPFSFRSQFQPATIAPEISAKQNLPLWRQGLDKTLTTLQSMVVIRYHEKQISPVLPPMQQQLVVAHIQLQLEKAQWAVLYENQAVFDNSLNDAKTWMNQYFTQNEASTAVMATLASLLKKSIQQTVPDLSASLAALKTALASDSNQTTQTVNATKELWTS